MIQKACHRQCVAFEMHFHIREDFFYYFVCVSARLIVYFVIAIVCHWSCSCNLVGNESTLVNVMAWQEIGGMWCLNSTSKYISCIAYLWNNILIDIVGWIKLRLSCAQNSNLSTVVHQWTHLWSGKWTKQFCPRRYVIKALFECVSQMQSMFHWPSCCFLLTLTYL